jgi:hypothetical protein
VDTVRGVGHSASFDTMRGCYVSEEGRPEMSSWFSELISVFPYHGTVVRIIHSAKDLPMNRGATMSLRGSGSLKSRETPLQYRRLRRLATIATWAFWSQFEGAGKADLLVDYMRT